MPRLFTSPYATFIYLPLPSPPEYLIGFARITQVVQGGPGEQLLHLLHTSYATEYRFSEFIQRIFSYGDIQNTHLTPDKELTILT